MLQRSFERDGYVVVRGLLDSNDVAAYRAGIIRLSGVGDDQYGESVFECPDGVSRHREFWPLITNSKLLSVLRELLGDEICYTQHSDLHAHRTGGWHRDSACRKFGEGPDWDETRDPYKVVRVAIYLQSFAESCSSLGVVPGSHRYESRFKGREAAFWKFLMRLSSRSEVFGRLVGLYPPIRREDHRMAMWTVPSRFRRRPSYPVWIETEPGDCIIFNQRLYHSASPIKGPKYAMYLSYSVPNSHARNHMGYYRHFRKDLQYGDLDPELAKTLQESGLYITAPEPKDVNGYFSGTLSGY